MTSAGSKLALIRLLADLIGPPPVVTEAIDTLREALGRRLTGAQAAGAIRADVSVDEIHVLIRALAGVSTQPDVTDRHLRAVIARWPAVHPD
ncbi:MAG: hypothetical protein S0880_03905 [Actinomycetota bacterium]|nr:hypothetical protein [Actinomycetota bacterium]